MMTNRRLLGSALGGAAIAMALTCGSSASAQRVTRVVAFGDSYADTGNAFALAGINPVSTIIYPTGRFTGGTNYVDTLGQIYSVTPQDFAIGGALTGNTNTQPGLPGFGFEWATYLAGGGGVFPTVPGTFSSGDLVTVSIGGNDARVYQQGGGTVAGAPAAAAVAVTQASAGLTALVNAGAPTISFLAGNTALLPEVAGDPAAQAVRQAYSTAYNQGMQATLAGYAAHGVMVHYLDLTTLLQQVQANPSAYGFTNLGPCAPIPQCVTDATYASQYVFWVDALHPTSHASQIFAQYIARQLEAPLTLEAPSQVGLDAGREFGRTLTTRLDFSAARYGVPAPGIQFFVVGDYFSRNVPADLTADRYEIRDYGATVGAQYNFPNGVVGIAGNYSRPKATFTNGAAMTRDRTWQIGGFAGGTFEDGFVQGYVGYGHDKHRINRAGVVEGMSASPSGNHWLAGGKAGYLLPFGGLKIGPVIALDYAKAKVDAYTETGDPTLTLNVGSASAKALEGSIGAELRGDLSANGLAIRPFFSAVLAKDLQGDGRIIQFDETVAPTIVNSWPLEQRSKHIYGKLSGGASAQLFDAVSIDALVSGTVDRKGGNDLSAHVGLKVGF